MTIREALKEAYTKIDKLDAGVILANLLTQRHSGTENNSNIFSQRRGDAADAEKKFKVVTRANLLAMSDEIISEEKFKLFMALVERRVNGECVAYIIGKKEFYGLEFFVNKSVLVPRPETELLIEATLQLIENREQRTENSKIRILDLCTGSGAIAIALKHELPELEVYATDISHEALEVAKINAANLLSNNNCITFYQGDLLEALPSHCSLLTAHCSLLPTPHSPLPTTYSLIISNPPYIPKDEIETLSKEVRNEPQLALDGGETGLEIIERIIKDAPKYLEKNGFLLLEADPRQMEKIKILLENTGFHNIIIYKDLAGFDRVIGGVFEKEICQRIITN